MSELMKHDFEHPESVESNRLMAHGYDGIQEYDNPMPRWWVWLFWAPILLALPYFAWFHIGIGPSLDEQLQVQEGANAAVRLALLGDLQPDQDTILSLMTDEEKLPAAIGIFRGKCVACHGVGGVGGTGPNLTDDHYIAVKTVEDIYATINDGRVEKGMPAWGKDLSQPERVILTSYVASLRGTSDGSGKAAEGEIAPPWPEASAAPAGDAEETGEGDAAPDPGTSASADDEEADRS